MELFIGFLELNIKNSKVINTIASCTFGVYLIHTNRIVRPALSKLFPIYKQKNPALVFVYSMAAVCAMYITFSLIDYLRQLTVEKAWISFLDKHLDSIQAKVTRVIRKIASGVKKIGKAYYEE